MSSDPSFDFWYAVNNTHLVVPPSSRLETFGNTMVNYHLVSELMDAVDKVRIREGRVEAFRPQIITPEHLGPHVLDGFGQDAQDYLQWLRTHQHQIALIQYGFQIRKQESSQHVVSDRLEAVTERVQRELQAKKDPLGALLVGVDEPWEVCLVKLMADLVGRSVSANVHDLHRDPEGKRQAVEAAFARAARDASQLAGLSALLEKSGLFSEYQDRFFALVRSHRKT